MDVRVFGAGIEICSWQAVEDRIQQNAHLEPGPAA